MAKIKFEPISKHDIIMNGYVGSILCPMIISHTEYTRRKRVCVMLCEGVETREYFNKSGSERRHYGRAIRKQRKGLSSVNAYMLVKQSYKA